MQVKTLKPSDKPSHLLKVGNKRAGALEKHGIDTIEKLLYYFPRRYLNRTNIKPINQLKPGDKVTLIGQIRATGAIPGRKRRFEAILDDGSGHLNLVWFGRAGYIKNSIKKGAVLSVTGEVKDFYGLQIVHPEFEQLGDKEDAENLLHTAGIVPLYSSGSVLAKVGLTSRGFRNIIREALDRCGHLMPEFMPEFILKELTLPEIAEALEQIHFPEDEARLETARQRLAFEELFLLQIAIATVHAHNKRTTKDHVYQVPGELLQEFKRSLPFKLTGAQARVLGEIFDDLRQDGPMSRLLLGDVGSGKTVVALAAILYAVENDLQTAFMAPTELLAEQHYNTITRMLAGFDLNIKLLSGSLKTRQRRLALEEIASGYSDIVVGTHALISADVRYERLGLVVIDEQHRFGVAQRTRLREKGRSPDLLVMTATPIPRSLALTVYGDLNLSVIDKLPPGRKPVKTALRPLSAREKVYEFIRSEIKKKRQAYIVYPLVEESEKLNLKAATREFERLSEKVFPEFKLALIHGRLGPEEREQIASRFRNGKIDILVATTVIEVGVDVPRASIMLIENAERFGLSQLHQLRGRVGRGESQSYCILLADEKASETATERLKAIASTQDGFEIAEFDLRLRGPGEFLGERQHGLPEFRLADIIRDAELLKVARKYAFDIVSKKIKLPEKQGKLLKQTIRAKYSGLLSHLFGG